MTWIIWCLLQYFYFYLFSSHIIFYKVLITLSHSLLNMVILSLCSLFYSFLQLFFILMNHCDFLKLYFGFICFGVVFFNFPLQVAYFSLLQFWFNFLFELILDYFGSKNLNLYQNTIMATNTSVQFGLLQSNSVYSIHVGPFGSIRSNSQWICQY